MKHSVSGGENSKLIGLDVRVKSEIEKQWNEFKMSSNNDDAKAGIVVPDEITGSGKDELEQLFLSYDIMKFNTALLDDLSCNNSISEQTAMNEAIFSQYFKKRKAYVTARYGWKKKILPALRDAEKVGSLALLIGALENDFELLQGWMVATKSGYHKPHKDNLTKGATHRIIISFACHGKVMTFYSE